jgi:hypothetical protein
MKINISLGVLPLSTLAGTFAWPAPMYVRIRRTVTQGISVRLVHLAVGVAAVLCGSGVMTSVAVAANPSFSVSDTTVVEGTGPTGGGTALFTVSLDGTVPAGGASIRVQTSALTATDGVDYTAPPVTTLTFPEDALTTRSQTVAVAVAGDATNEYDETLQLVLTNQAPAGLVSIADPIGVATVTDDDTPPSVSVADTLHFEGTNNFTLMTFTVTLSAPSGKTVKVDWTTRPGTAADSGAGADYTPLDPPTPIEFLPGVVSRQVSVQVTGDAVDEDDETFDLVLSNARNNPSPPNPASPIEPTIVDATATATIQDDDGPTANIADVTVNEGEAGTTQTASLVVALSAVSAQDVGVSYTTADDTAKAPDDYAAITSAQSLVIPAGSLTGRIDVTVRGDALDEVDETLKVNLTTPVHGTITRSTGIVTIKDGTPSPAITVDDVSVLEGTGGTKASKLTARLSTASGRALQVRYTTQDVTATAGVDYLQASDVITFAPGETAKELTIPVATDDAVEEDETFILGFAYTVGDGPSIRPATVTVVDDDLNAGNTPTLSIGDATVREGDSGSKDAVFTVRLDAPLARKVTVRYATRNGTATAPEDYAARQGTLTFPVGTVTRTISVPVAGDVAREPNQEFTVELSGALNARLMDAGGQGIITDDDAGGGPVTVSPKVVSATSLLCRRGKTCTGLLVRWTVASRGTIGVAVSAMVPAAAPGKGAKGRAVRPARKPAAKPVRLRLIDRRFKVDKVGAGKATIRMNAGPTAARLLARLRAAKVRTVLVAVTFTNRSGAAQTTTFELPLRLTTGKVGNKS